MKKSKLRMGFWALGFLAFAMADSGGCSVWAAGNSPAQIPHKRERQRITCRKPWVFFDLGANTLVDTGPWPFANVVNHRAAREYLQLLHAKGFRLGMLVDVPPTERGISQAEKLAMVKKILLEAWKPGEPAFDWTIFDLGVRFNGTLEERKDESPYLFQQAAADANDQRCDAVYISAIPEELVSAWQNGMYGIPVAADDSYSWDGMHFYPVEKLIRRDFRAVCRKMQLGKCEPNFEFLEGLGN